MKAVIHSLMVLAVVLGFSGSADAAVIGTYTHDYGRTPGRVAPDTYGRLRGDHVLVENAASGATDFADSIDFSGVGVVGTDVTIDSIDLELTFDRAGPNANISENWFVEISGAGAGLGSSTFALLFDVASPQTVQIASGTDAFDAALSGMQLDFTFVEPGTGRRDTFRLFQARLTVNGSTIAAVPLPAPGLLLLAGIGGLVLLRTRGTGAKDKPQT